MILYYYLASFCFVCEILDWIHTLRSILNSSLESLWTCSNHGILCAFTISRFLHWFLLFMNPPLPVFCSINSSKRFSSQTFHLFLFTHRICFCTWFDKLPTLLFPLTIYSECICLYNKREWSLDRGNGKAYACCSLWNFLTRKSCSENKTLLKNFRV